MTSGIEFSLFTSHNGRKTISASFDDTILSVLHKTAYYQMVQQIVTEFCKRYVEERFEEVAAKIDIADVLKAAYAEVGARLMKNMFKEEK
jgi:hypothetical protein